MKGRIVIEDKNSTSPALIFAAWLVVSIPAAWGVYNTVLNAMKLLH
jgi:hypothetical protein